MFAVRGSCGHLLRENWRPPSKRNPSLRGGRTIFHKRWQKDPPVCCHLVVLAASKNANLFEASAEKLGFSLVNTSLCRGAVQAPPKRGPNGGQ